MSGPPDLSEDDVKLIREALESHAYWQVSEQHYRNNGFVYAPGADDPDAAAELERIDALSIKLGGGAITGEKS